MGAEAAYLPALISAIGGIGSAGVSAYGSNKAANTQAQAGEDALQFQKDVYHNDLRNAFEASKYLTGSMPMFSDPNQYFGTDSVNKQFDISRGNLNQAALGQAAQSAGQAGALAASRGLANPSGFTANAFQSSLGQFAPQFGALEANRASALNQNQKALFDALFRNQQTGFQNKLATTSQFGAPTSPYGLNGWRG